MTGKGRGGDFSFSVPRNGRNLAAAWARWSCLPPELKIELGGMLLDLLPKRKMEPVRAAMVWAIGRLGARVPLYGPLNAVVPADVAGRVARRRCWRTSPGDGRPVGGDAACPADGRPLSRPAGEVRTAAARWLQRQSCPAHFVELVLEGGLLDSEEQGMVFGESLPKGLRLG